MGDADGGWNLFQQLTGHLHDGRVDSATRREGASVQVALVFVADDRQLIGLLNLGDDGAASVDAELLSANLPDEDGLALDDVDVEGVGQYACDAGIGHRRQRFDGGCVGLGVGKENIDAI